MKIHIICSLVLVSICFTNCQSQPKKQTALTTTDTVYTYQKASRDGIGKYYLGREISFVMGAAASNWLERDEREQEENAKLAIDKIDIPTNGVIADIGAGTGYYSFKLSPKVAKGKVYAVEMQDELITYLKNKKIQINDTVVEVVKSTSLTPNLPENSIDIAMMVDVYHELEYPHEMLQALRKSLKSTGNILLIEYRGEDPAVAIKPLHKTTVTQLNKEMLANGFKLKFKGDFLPIQHFLLYEKL
jgi:precorrin-6B methylase 2